MVVIPYSGSRYADGTVRVARDLPVSAPQLLRRRYGIRVQRLRRYRGTPGLSEGKPRRA